MNDLSPPAALALASPDPDLTPDGLVARATALRETLRARQAECEAAGCVPAATQQAFLDAGFYRTVQPRRFGGYEFDVPTFIRVMMEVARGCPASAWVLALTAGHTIVLANFDERAQREAYGATGDFRAPHVGSPGGAATRGPDGWRLAGAWDYASGCDLATHFLCGTVLRDEAGTPLGTGFAFVPRRDYSIIDNWRVMGMQGTGSRRVVVDDAPLPAWRVMPRTTADGRPIATVPGLGSHANPMYCKPLASFLVGELAAVAIGAARGAVDLYEALLLAKKSHFPPFEGLHETREHQLYFGRAHALVATAEAAVLNVGAQYMEFARRDAAGGPPFDDRCDRHLLLIEQQAVELAWQATDLLFRTSGTSGGRADSPLGRHFRDLAMIRTHITARGDRTAENWARLSFGLAPLSPL